MDDYTIEEKDKEVTSYIYDILTNVTFRLHS